MRRKCDDERRAALWKGVLSVVLGALLGTGAAWAWRWGAWRWQEETRASEAVETAFADAWLAATAGMSEELGALAAVSGDAWESLRAAERANAERLAQLAEDEGRASRLLGEWRDGAAAERAGAARAMSAMGVRLGSRKEEVHAAWSQVRKEMAAGAWAFETAVGTGSLGTWRERRRTKKLFEEALGRWEEVCQGREAWREGRELRVSALRRLRALKESPRKRAEAARGEASQAVARAEGAAYDPGQGFGERLAALRERFGEGEAAMPERKYRDAMEAYGEVCAEAERLAADAAARTEAERRRAAAEAARARADPVGGGTAWKKANREAKRSWTAAAKAHEAGDFAASGAEWARAAEKWARAEAEGREERVREEMLAGRKAARGKQWEEARAAAARALALDSGNEEADALLSMAERQLRPSVRLTAVLDGREVAATVTEGVETTGLTTPVEVDLPNGGEHAFAVSYEEGGKRYEGRTTVRVPERGMLEARLDLADIDAFPTTVWLTAEAAGREVSATITKGAEREGLKTPAVVILETGGRHEFELSYEEFGKRYEGRLAVDAAPNKLTEARAVLEELPEIYLMATLNGRLVAATVTEGVTDHGLKTPVTVKLEKGGQYPFAVAYEEGGKRYEGRTTVRAASHGRTAATVALAVPPPSILLTATLGGQEVAATVTEGLADAGLTTPVRVNLERGGIYEFSLAYEKNGKRYARRTTVTAADSGETAARVALDE